MVGMTDCLEVTEHLDRDRFRLQWWCSDEKQSASTALAQIRRETKLVKQGSTKGRPDWAIKASAAGWKPPKNWKP